MMLARCYYPVMGSSAVPNGLSKSPGEYTRKSETQRDRRENTQAVDDLD
jgi:hypothetical protein